MKTSFDYKSRFKILKGGKIALVVSALLVGTSLVHADTQTVSTGVTSNYVIADGDGLEVTSGGSIIVTGDWAVENAGAVTSITNDGIISTDTDGTDAIYIDGIVSGDITNNGTISNTNSDNSNDSAIEINQGYVSGSIINNGTIISAADNGIAVWGDDDDDQSDNLGVVLGGIINNGTITAYNEGLDLDDDARIENGITNNGTITGQNDVAIEIDETTVVNGGITNNSGATIKSTSTDAIEIVGDAILNGGILNYGTIQGDADGIFMEDDDSEINGGITNYGTIIGGDDALDFNDDATFSGDIKNYGTIIGADYSIDFGSDVVTSGAIYNYEGGKIIGLLEVSPTSTINFTNSGLLVLKDGVTLGSEKTTGTIGLSRLLGNYIQTSTGELNLAIDSKITQMTTYSYFFIGGDATFSANAKISLDIQNSGTNLSNNDVIEDIITASGTLTTSTFDITDNLLAWKFTATNDGTGNIDLTAIATGLTTVEAAVTGDEKGAGTALDGINDNEVATAISSLNSISEVQSAVKQTLPTLSGETSSISFESMKSVNNIIQARVEGSTGLSSGDKFFEDKYVWMKPFGSWAKQDTTTAAVGYTSDTYGLVIGTDNAINNTDRFGMALSYAKASIDSNNNLQNSHVDIIQLIGYGSRKLSPNLEANLQVDVSHSRTDAKRTINFGGLSNVAAADYSSKGFHVGAGISKLYELQSDLKISATLRGDYTYIKDDSYTETGAGALNLSVDSNSASQFILFSGAKFVKELEDMKLTANLGAGYDFNAKQNSITASYAGNSSASFITKGQDTKPWVFRTGIGAVVQNYKGIEVSLNYDLEAKEDFTNQTVALKGRWNF